MLLAGMQFHSHRQGIRGTVALFFKFLSLVEIFSCRAMLDTTEASSIPETTKCRELMGLGLESYGISALLSGKLALLTAVSVSGTQCLSSFGVQLESAGPRNVPVKFVKNIISKL